MSTPRDTHFVFWSVQLCFTFVAGCSPLAKIAQAWDQTIGKVCGIILLKTLEEVS